MSEWIPIQYSSFCDVPRTFAVYVGGRTLLFISFFLEDEDEWDDHFEVFAFPGELGLDGIWDWRRPFPRPGIMRIPVAQVRFDPSRRREVDLDSLGLPEDGA